MPVENMPRLEKKQWLARIERYIEQDALRADGDRQARKARDETSTIRDEIIDAMAGSPVAFCGEYVLTVVSTPGVGATITRKSDLREFGFFDELLAVVLRDGTQIPIDDISALYGGRSGYKRLHVEKPE